MVKAATVGTKIVERIAAREGVDPGELDVKLYDSINPDALETLTNETGDRQAGERFSVEFAFHGYVVTVDGGGDVTIHPKAAETDERSKGGVPGD